MSESGTAYDVIVIGGGPAGENAAQYAIQGSERTAAIVEGELTGGECSYWACMPSKALLRPVDVLATAHALGGSITGADLDVAALLRRRDEWVSHYDDSGQVSWAEGAGITVVRGRGRLAGPKRVAVQNGTGTTYLSARAAIVIATGSVPTFPDEIADLCPWTSRDATGMKEVPDSIAVIGGGVVACEAATWLAAAGAHVTMLVRGERLLARAEDFAGEAVHDALRTRGVDVRTGVTVTDAERPDAADSGVGRVHGGPMTLQTSTGPVTAAEVLAATGRKPAVDDVGLGTVGLGDRRSLGDVSDLDWLYAVGDVTGEAPLTHWGKYQARLVGAQIAAHAEGRPGPARPDAVPVPQVVFTDPQVASVGLTAAAARAAGHGIETYDADMAAASGYGLLRDDAAGHARLVVATATGTLLGATFVGTEVAEMIHAATVAVVAKVPVSTLWHAVPSYPTVSEIWLRLLEEHRAATG
ncbi:MAG: dihydrolipoyl dehydrogenase family protein [Mycobacteriales bacterium]